jgi:hypothetical protein
MNTIDLLWELTTPATQKLGVLLRPDKFMGTEIQPELDDEGNPYFTLRKLYEVLDVDSIEIVNVPNSELILVCDEEGLLKAEPLLNRMASLLAEQQIVGNALLCHTDLIK